MNAMIRTLCALSVFCGAAMLLTPEGSSKKLVSVCCSVVLMLSMFSSLRALDYDAYALELARYRELGKSISEDAESESRNLNKTLVKQELESYITAQASSFGIDELNAEVTVRWTTEGFWLPDKVRLTGRYDQGQQKKLRDRITADLGLSEGDQEWIALESESAG